MNLFSIYIISAVIVSIKAKISINCDSTSCTETVVELAAINNYHEVNINCIGDNICNSAVFNCPVDASCNVRCRGTKSCFNTFFNASQANNFSIIEGSGGDSVLQQTKIICPIKGSCSISNITSKYGMSYARVYAQDTVSGDLRYC